MASSSHPTSERLLPPIMRRARFEDYGQIIGLEMANSLETQPEGDWRGVWLDNPVWPRLANVWPIGWVLEDNAGEIVGSLLNIPTLYHFGGRELICANGRAWVARPEYRGLALMLMDEYYNQAEADLFVNTTVGPMSLEITNELSSRVPVGDWESVAYFVTGYRGFARKALEKMRVPLPGLLAGPAGMALRLKDAVGGKTFPALPAGFVIEQAAEFDARFDDFWRELARQNVRKLLAARDRATLSWHFAIPLRRGRLWIVTASRNGRICDYCIFKRHDQARGIQRMRLIDYQTLEPEIDLLPAMVHVAMQRCSLEGIDILDHHGCGVPKMRSFDELAPYRQKLGNWTFYYHARDTALHEELSRAEAWDPSLFDGDASFE